MKEKQMSKNKDMQNPIHIEVDLNYVLHLCYVSLKNKMMLLLNQYVELLDDDMVDYEMVVDIPFLLYMLT
jgi:hypothetical protein